MNVWIPKEPTPTSEILRSHHVFVNGAIREIFSIGFAILRFSRKKLARCHFSSGHLFLSIFGYQNSVVFRHNLGVTEISGRGQEATAEQGSTLKSASPCTTGLHMTPSLWDSALCLWSQNLGKRDSSEGQGSMGPDARWAWAALLAGF